MDSKRTKLITDVPADKDDFGSHQQIADAIIQLINSEDGGKTIGIEGGWGSGKSTIIRFIKKSLKDDKEVKVIVFDTWSHEGDPLRKSFIETVLSGIESFNWFSPNLKKKWQIKREELARRRKVTDKHNTPVLTSLGKTLSVCLMLVPLGMAMFGSGLSGVFSAKGDLPYEELIARYIIAILGSLLALSPLLTFGMVAFFNKDKEKGKLEELFNLFVQKTISHETSEVIENPDPTSNEFEKIFSELMNDSLKEENRKIILVIDNLDRISAEDAVKMLSTLRTFLEYKFNDDEVWIKKLWVLIPYDLEGLKNLWKGVLNTTNSFIDKIFQIKFYVPAPILSDRRSFLIELLRNAFPDNNEQEYHYVYRVYNLLQKGTPTPRQLKLYVNGIGALHRQWGSQISLHVLAIFYLLKSRAESPLCLETLKSDELDSKEIRMLADDTLRDQLAALLFNIDVSKASQVLLKQPIEDALIHDKGFLSLDSLSKSSSGFWEVFENELPGIISPWITQEPELVMIASDNITQSNILESSRRETSIIKNTLIKTAIEIKSFLSFNQNIANGITSISMLTDEDNIVINLISKIPQVTKISKNDDEIVLKIWIGAAFNLLYGLSNLNKYHIIKNGIPLTDDPIIFLNACSELNEFSSLKEFWSNIKFLGQTEQLTTSLIANINSGIQTPPINRVILSLRLIYPNYNWVPIINSINTVLMNVNADIENVANYLFALIEIDSPEAKNSLNQLVDGFRITNYLYTAKTKNLYNTVALLMYIYLSRVPSADKIGNFQNSNLGYNYLRDILQSPNNLDIINSFNELIIKQNDIDLLLNMNKYPSTCRNFVLNCLKYLLSNKNLKTLIPPQRLLANWKDFKDILESSNKTSEDFNSLIANCADLEHVEYIMNNGFNEHDVYLYHTIMKDRDELNLWYINGLKEIESSSWKNHLSLNDDVISFLLFIQGKFKVNLNIRFQDGIQDYLKDVILGSQIPPYTMETWNKIFACLSSNLQKALIARVYDFAVEQQGAISDNFFELFDDKLIDTKTIIDNQKSLSHFFSPLISSNNKIGRKWIKRLFASHKQKILGNMPQEDLNEFMNRLKAQGE